MRDLKTIGLIWLVTTTLFLSACSNSGQLPPFLKSLFNQGPVQTQGPSDGGGGDICKKRPIEDFRIELADLEEYQRFVLPILRRASPQKNSIFTNEDNNTVLAPSIYAAVTKSWYLMDCDIETVSQEKKGLPIKSIQAAFHIGREIFISKKDYEPMQIDKKAYLLLHEIVMGYYLMKYMSLNEICQITEGCKEKDIRNNWKVFAPLKYQTLNGSDHQAIRAMTNWLWENQNFLTPENFNQQLKINDFDHRFDPSFKPQTADLNIESEKIANVINTANLTQTLPQNCQFDSQSLESQTTCQTTIQAQAEIKKLSFDQELNQLNVKIQIKRKSDGQMTENDFANYRFSGTGLTIKSKIISSNLNLGYLELFSNWPKEFEDLKIGHKAQKLVLFLDIQDPKEPKIKEISIVTYVASELKNIEVPTTTMGRSASSKSKIAIYHRLDAESEILSTEKTLLFDVFSKIPETVKVQIGEDQNWMGPEGLIPPVGASPKAEDKITNDQNRKTK